MIKQIKKINSKSLIDFNATFSLLLNAGLSVQDSITMMKDISENKKTSEIASILEEDLQKGDSLSKILLDKATFFPPLYRGLVSIGDQVGSLNSILPTLQNYFERNKDIKDKIINASIYPIIVFSIAIIGVILLVLIILPNLQNMFLSIGASKLQIEAVNKNISHFQILGVVFLIFSLSLIMLVPLRRNNNAIKKYTDSFALSIPLINNIIMNFEIFNLSFAIEVLSSNGVPLTTALRESEKVCQNEQIKIEINDIQNCLINGDSLYSAFRKQQHIPKKVIQWVALGERTGNTENVFKQLRLYYESEIENISKRFMGIIEPILIIIVGLIIISMIAAFVIPLFSMFGNLI